MYGFLLNVRMDCRTVDRASALRAALAPVTSMLTEVHQRNLRKTRPPVCIARYNQV